MTKRLPSVLILYTGGTFGMEILLDHRLQPTQIEIPDLSPRRLKERFMEQVPELQKLANCDVDILMNRDSAHIGPDDWVSFARIIQSQWKKYDGIILLHGTDTLAYTASALSFLLRPCLKPVVLTGAQRPLSALRTDARTNLISAVEIAARGPKKVVNQVTVFFGNHLFQGNRIRKHSASDYAAFESPHSAPLAIVGTNIRYTANPPKLHLNNKVRLRPKFHQKVLITHGAPGFPSEAFTKALLDELDGIVLVAFLSGTAPTHDPKFNDFLNEAHRRKIPIIIATEGTTVPPNTVQERLLYAAGKELMEQGCYWAGNMTPECAYVKTLLLLGQSKNQKRFAQLWATDLAGEGVHEGTY